MLPAAYLRQTFVRPLLTKAAALYTIDRGRLGNEPSSCHCPVPQCGHIWEGGAGKTRGALARRPRRPAVRTPWRA